VDGWIHGTSLLYKPDERRLRRLPWKRPVEEPKPTDWRSVLQSGYAEPQYQTFTARPARGPTLTPPTAPPAPPTGSGPAKRRLSALRVLVALAVVAGIGYGGYATAKTRLFTTPVTVNQTWFAPYVDVTLTPTYQFQTPSQDPAQQSVLGFVVASSQSDCTPSWGAAYSLATANQQLALGTRIAQLQQEGEQAIVSFGGQANTSLDVACSTTADLTAGYQSVINAYRLKSIDLDIEGTALDNLAAGQRRAAAMATLEKDNSGLSVWLTLPVEPSGLQDNALSVIKEMLNDHVSIAGINLMTMDFSARPAAGSSMAASVEAALNAAHGQLTDLYPTYGIKLNSEQIWQRIGATVMIGQNDIKGEIFTVSDAKAIAGFAGGNHLGRVSMWSVNRDSQCGSLYSDTGMLSNTCSGTPQSALEFSQTFGKFHGTAPTAASSTAVQPAVADTNPADAPYPLWNASTNYPAGYKVVENGEIYQAKWYNSGDDPSTQVQYSYQTPWELLGPVVPGDHASAVATLPAGTYPAWSQDTQYQRGNKVLYQGRPYQAKWVNQGVSPATESTDPSGSAWKALYSIPGEPSGAPALGSPGGSSSPSSSPSPSPATPLPA
jgi:chitinase